MIHKDIQLSEDVRVALSIESVSYNAHCTVHCRREKYLLGDHLLLCI
jgi:hypothetical protein